MLLERLGPRLLLVLLEKTQLSKRMSIAEGMLTLRILRIAVVTVMLHRPVKVREDTDGIGGSLAAFPMNGVMSEIVGPNHMQPVHQSLDPKTRLIRSRDLCRL